MKTFCQSCFLLLIFTFSSLPSRIAELGLSSSLPVDSIVFYDGQLFSVIGKYHQEKNYVRFPETYREKLRKEVWDLGQHSAGISIRFCSNADTIKVRWTVKFDNSFDHMPLTGIKGVDLYAFTDGFWKYVNTGRVEGKQNEFTLVKTVGSISREYLLNLPLYDGVESLSIGINSSAEISLPKAETLLAKKPVVYYGTSIAQGGCASRPGMAFTNILERAMDRCFINMGFSGNGTFDQSVGEAMCEIDASLYVIDCIPNTQNELIYERAIALVKQLKLRRPSVPVLLVDAYNYESGFGNSKESVTAKKMSELQRAFEEIRESGIPDIFYLQGDGLIGYDHEGTVDGVHPNDLGMMRMAESLQPVIRKILNE
jgi:hypothetical protein